MNIKKANTMNMLFCLIAVFALSVSANQSAEEEQIKNVMLQHTNSWERGITKDMAESMHPQIAHKGLVKGKLMISTYAQLVEWTKAREGIKPEKSEEYTVTVLSIDDNIASIKGETNKHTEYAHLMKDKESGNWVIVNYIYSFND